MWARRGRVPAALPAACAAARLHPHPLLRSARPSESLGCSDAVSPTLRCFLDSQSRPAQRRTATGGRTPLPSLPLRLAAYRPMVLGRCIDCPSVRPAGLRALRLLMKHTKLSSRRTTIPNVVSRCSAVLSPRAGSERIDPAATLCFSLPRSFPTPPNLPKTASPPALHPLSEVLSRIPSP